MIYWIADCPNQLFSLLYPNLNIIQINMKLFSFFKPLYHMQNSFYFWQCREQFNINPLNLLFCVWGKKSMPIRRSDDSEGLYNMALTCTWKHAAVTVYLCRVPLKSGECHMVTMVILCGSDSGFKLFVFRPLIHQST